MASILRYWHTLRHLRPVQIYGRIWFRVARPRVDDRPAPRVRALTGAWVEPIARHKHLALPTRARFLNEERDITATAIWNDPTVAKLWLYNLHYFEDLATNSSPGVRRLEQEFMQRWIAENPPASGNGWEPYPTSMRIVNWIKWALAGNEIPEEVRKSLAVQTRWLSRRCEHHLLANHLFVNAKALAFAGMYFDGAESDGWLRQSQRILARELNEQVLTDGGHFELSPMYHALILEDILDIINAAHAFAPRLPEALLKKLCAKASIMIGWLGAMSHPDGEISYFNDASMGIAPTHAQCVEYANRLGVPGTPQSGSSLIVLGASGYVRAQAGSAVLLVDHAAVGCKYQPGHAHADTLSFELSINGLRAIVNSGTSTYALGATRSHERSTAAHNTLEVASSDSSEVWGAFRVARRALVQRATCNERDGAITIAAAHTGYLRLGGGTIHQRRMTLRDHTLSIIDSVEGKAASAVARIHLHPSLRRTGPATFQLSDGAQLSFEVRGGSLEVVSTSWAREFGLLQPNLCVELTMTQPEMTTTVSWT